MSAWILEILVLAPTAGVVGALATVLWRARTSVREGRTALVVGGLLTAWAVLETILARAGVFRPAAGTGIPAIGINFILVMLSVALGVGLSPSLRSLLSPQSNLIRLNVWRLVGIVFLLLMVQGEVPALWAVPAGIGDVLIGLAAFWVASGFDAPGGKRRAIIFNVLGLADLAVAVGLGVTTSPGPLQIFLTTPTSTLLSQFPLALVPTFLVPLAVSLHVVSLWQLIRGNWRNRSSHEQQPRNLTRRTSPQVA